jgi:hypothetical protein
MHDFESCFKWKGENLCALCLGVLAVVCPISGHCNEVDECINTLRENKNWYDLELGNRKTMPQPINSHFLKIFLGLCNDLFQPVYNGSNVEVILQ